MNMRHLWILAMSWDRRTCTSTGHVSVSNGLSAMWCTLKASPMLGLISPWVTMSHLHTALVWQISFVASCQLASHITWPTRRSAYDCNLKETLCHQANYSRICQIYQSCGAGFSSYLASCCNIDPVGRTTLYKRSYKIFKLRQFQPLFSCDMRTSCRY